MVVLDTHLLIAYLREKENAYEIFLVLKKRIIPSIQPFLIQQSCIKEVKVQGMLPKVLIKFRL